jgi:hypothetical protein
MNDYQDKYGLYHHVKHPDPMASENAPLFTAMVLLLKFLKTTEWHKVNSQARRALLALGYEGKFSNVAVDHLKKNNIEITEELSYDNFLGVMVLHLLADWKFNFFWDWRVMLNPAKACTVLYLRYPWLLPCGLIWFIATSYSMTRELDTRKGKVNVPAASNKQLTWLICQAWDKQLSFKWFTWILSKNKLFRDWSTAFKFYYSDPDHPIRKML